MNMPAQLIAVRADTSLIPSGSVAYSRINSALLAALTLSFNPVLASAPDVRHVSPALRQHRDGIKYLYLQRLIRVGIKLLTLEDIGDVVTALPADRTVA
jgi:hypothetical protein